MGYPGHNTMVEQEIHHGTFGSGGSIISTQQCSWYVNEDWKNQGTIHLIELIAS